MCQSSESAEYGKLCEDFRGILEQGMAAMDIPCDSGLIEHLLQFQQLLLKWNRAYNLTAIRDPEKILRLHLLDSLAVLPHLRGEHILDVGTGGGLPGIPLALANPDKTFVLLDSNAKKTRFVNQVILELGLKNINVVRQRVEDFQVKQRFDTIVTRAYAEVDKVIPDVSPVLDATGTILAMVGKKPGHQRCIAGFALRVVPLRIPGIIAERHLIVASPGKSNRSTGS